jgi:hypothetical protein
MLQISPALANRRMQAGDGEDERTVDMNFIETA